MALAALTTPPRPPLDIDGQPILAYAFTGQNEGIVLCDQGQQDDKDDKHFCTWKIETRNGGIRWSASWGHYDMRLPEAKADFANRVERGL